MHRLLIALVSLTPGAPRFAVFETWDCEQGSCYHQPMAKPKKFDLDHPSPVFDDEDEETLAAIDEGMRDADEGRKVTTQEVRQLLPKWTTASSTRKKR